MIACTTEFAGEEEYVTTLAVGEETDSTQPIGEEDTTTHAVGEEGWATSMAEGEESEVPYTETASTFGSF